jgi:hypothetical protein
LHRRSQRFFSPATPVLCVERFVSHIALLVASLPHCCVSAAKYRKKSTFQVCNTSFAVHNFNFRIDFSNLTTGPYAPQIETDADSASPHPTTRLLQSRSVFAPVADPVGDGFVANLRRPGGNIPVHKNCD